MKALATIYVLSVAATLAYIVYLTFPLLWS